MFGKAKKQTATIYEPRRLLSPSISVMSTVPVFAEPERKFGSVIAGHVGVVSGGSATPRCTKLAPSSMNTLRPREIHKEQKWQEDSLDSKTNRSHVQFSDSGGLASRRGVGSMPNFSSGHHHRKRVNMNQSCLSLGDIIASPRD